MVNLHIPLDSGRRFRTKPATDSDWFRPPPWMFQCRPRRWLNFHQTVF